MIKDFLKKNIASQASFVEYGYGQVEPNHLSAQASKQVYAQLPAAAEIDVLENGQFVKYDYANGVCNFTGAGEWMLVFNEIKLYRDDQLDCEFAMIKDNYQARLYSPFGGLKDGTAIDPWTDTNWDKQSRYYNGVAADATEGGVTLSKDDQTLTVGDKTFPVDDVTAAPDMYELDYNEDPFHIESQYHPLRMPTGTQMVPRVMKTNVGDIFTTNTINATKDQLTLGATLKVGAEGILEPGEDEKMTWQVVKRYTMPDHQAGVKLMRIV